jgi:hypothetical protein
VARRLISFGFGSPNLSFPLRLRIAGLVAEAAATSPTSVDLSLSGEGPAGGIGPYLAQWERSTTSGSAGFSDLEDALVELDDPHTDAAASDGTQYWYRARVIDSTGAYIHTAAVTVTTPTPAGNEILNAAASKDDTLNTATIEFDAGADTESASIAILVNGVLVETRTKNVAPSSVDNTETKTGLSDGDSVRFRVTPYSADDLGGEAGTTVERLVTLAGGSGDAEPDGMTTIFHNEGDTKDFGTGWGPVDAWDDNGSGDYNDDLVKVVADATNPTGSGFAIQKTFFGPETSEVEPGSTAGLIYCTLKLTGKRIYRHRLVTINGETRGVVDGSWSVISGSDGAWYGSFIPKDSARNVTTALPFSFTPTEGMVITLSGDPGDGEGSAGANYCSTFDNIPGGFVCKELYIRYRYFLSAVWPTANDLRGLKNFYFGNNRTTLGNPSAVQYWVDGLRKNSGDPMDAPWRFRWDENGFTQRGPNCPDYPDDNDNNSNPNSDRIVTLGEWHKLVIHMVAQSAINVPDGAVRVFYDGVLIWEDYDRNWVTDSLELGWTTPRALLGFTGFQLLNLHGSKLTPDTWLTGSRYPFDHSIRHGELYISGVPF